jgi:D-aminoacyl-tRNA deacylase
VNIIISKPDPASQNIEDNLLRIKKWKPIDINCENILRAFESDRFRLVEIEGLHIYQGGLDRRLTECGLDSDILIFASKHRSEDGRKILTVHPTGNTKEAKFGGRPMELSAAASQAMRSIYMNLDKLTKNKKFQVSLESTHHGPSDLITPSLFVEIGSSKTEWVDPAAGHIVACAILMYEIKNNVPIAVGFGGNHYASRQTELLKKTAVSFGHIFPTYKLDQLNKFLIKQAFERSHADFAYFDRKSMSVKQRHRINSIIENIGYEVIREIDIREMDGVPWQIYKQLRNKVHEFCPTGVTRITQSIKAVLRASFHKNELIELQVAAISPELLNEAEKLNRVHIESFIKKHCIVYVEQNNGRLSNCFIGMDNKDTSFMIKELTNALIY